MKTTKMSRKIIPEMLNARNVLFGGTMMSWMDEVAGITAERFVKADLRTAAVEKINFYLPVYQEARVDVTGEVIHVGNTSMKILITVWMDDVNGGADIKIADATFVYVAVDSEGKPKKIGKTLADA